MLNMAMAGLFCENLDANAASPVSGLTIHRLSVDFYHVSSSAWKTRFQSALNGHGA